MKHLSVLILVAFMLFTACQQPAVQPSEKADPKEAVLSTIHSRKSVRNFVKDKAVSKEDIETLLKAGMAAPTAVNLQPWHFMVVNDRATMDSLQVGLPYAKMLAEASAAIIVCGDTTIKAGNMAFWEFDCSLASANILLAAEAMGLGAVWTAVHPDPSRINWVRQQLNLPVEIVPLNLIPIGYPTGKDTPKDKYKAERIHWNNW